MIKNAYVILTHIYRPAAEKDKWQVIEEISFVDKINKTQNKEASVIIDVMREKLSKCRFPDFEYQYYIDYLIKQYPQNYKLLLELLERELPQELIDKIAEIENPPEVENESEGKVNTN